MAPLSWAVWIVVGVVLGVGGVLVWIGGVAQGLRVLIDGRRAWAAWRNPPPPRVALERARAQSQSMNSQWPDGHRRLSRASVSTVLRIDDDGVTVDSVGVRTRDGELERVLAQPPAPYFDRGSEPPVDGELDEEIVRDSHESDPCGGLLWWVKVHDRDGRLFELVHDPGDDWRQRSALLSR